MKKNCSDNLLLTVSCPWNTPYYYNHQGIKELYKSYLLDAPQYIKINTWDTISLNKYLQNCSKNIDASGYGEYLTAQLPGDIEFHHTIPVPSLTRPFVFHMESFIYIDRNYLLKVFKSPFCLGIFSNLVHTLDVLDNYLQDNIVSKKLYLASIGVKLVKDMPIKNPNSFVFFNFNWQDHDGFFQQNGHKLLVFWENYLNNYKGTLLINSPKPTNMELSKYQVNLDFLNAEINKSILWIESYQNSLYREKLLLDAQYYINFANDPDSHKIMQAMQSGTIPVLKDNPWVDSFIENKHTGIIVDTESNNSLQNSIIDFKLVNANLNKIQQKIRCFAQEKFDPFSSTALFWKKVGSNYAQVEFDNKLQFNQSSKKFVSINLDNIFNGPEKPVLKLYLDNTKIYNFAGAFYAFSNLEDPFVSFDNVQIADSIDKLEDTYLRLSDFKNLKERNLFIKFCSRCLHYFPALHSFAAMVLRKINNFYGFIFKKEEEML